MAAAPNGSSGSKPPTAAAAPPGGPGADKPDLTSLSGSGLYGDAAGGGGMGGVQGMLCADARGLCVQAKGVADPNAAGLFTSLIRRAGALAAAGASGENAEEALLAPPTVLMETERHDIIVKEYDDLTLAVYRAPGAGGRR